MKKYLITALTLILLAPVVAFAEGDENVTKRRPERAVEIQEIRQDRQESRQSLRSTVAENHANRLEKRFGFYFTRLDNIIARFQRRLDTLKTAGKDTAATQAKLDAAKAKLAEAKAKGAAAIAAFKAIDPDKFSEQKTEALAARDLANAARKLFVETHGLLKEAVRLLKAIV